MQPTNAAAIEATNTATNAPELTYEQIYDLHMKLEESVIFPFSRKLNERLPQMKRTRLAIIEAFHVAMVEFIKVGYEAGYKAGKAAGRTPEVEEVKQL